MFKNYFKTALRYFWRQKFLSLVNVTGLAIGISAAIVIYTLVSYELNFDKFEKDNSRIYRVVANYTFSGVPYKDAGAPYPMANAVRNKVAGVETAAPFVLMQGGFNGITVTVPEQKGLAREQFFRQEHVIFAGEDYFNLVQYKWLAGSPGTSLRQPYQTVLTLSNARVYFPALSVQEMIGKEVYFNDKVRTTVAGIVQDIEANTDFTFKTFISINTLETTALKPRSWTVWNSTDPGSQLFVKLAPGVPPTAVGARVTKLVAKYYQEKNPNVTTTYLLQPLSDIHFNAAYTNFNEHVTSKPTLYGLSAIAVFLLLLAAINFINLTTAQAAQRAKEIGVRKAIGSSKKQLMLQFLGETFLLTLTAAILSVGLTPLLLKIFAGFIPQGVHFSLLRQPGILLFLSGLVIGMSLLSGFYPALVLSSFNPVLVLKKNIFAGKGSPGSASLRKILTAAQFVIAQVFIIATVIVARQIHYELTADMGFKKDAIIYFDTNYSDPTGGNRKFNLREKVAAIPGVAMVSLSNSPASNDGGLRATSLKYKNGTKEISTQVKVKFADTNYIRLYQIKLLAGANLPNSDTIKGILINETYAKALGFTDPHQAIGKFIEWDDWGVGNVPVAGVLQDFHLRSLHEEISPMVIASRANEHLVFNIALQPQAAGSNTWSATIANIQKAFKQVFPDDDWHYSFMDDTIARYYSTEKNISALLAWATGLSVFISCLGLAGLVIYVTNQRAKEMSIRKVVGATVTQLVILLSKDFLKLVVAAFVIAVPVAWYLAGTWLQTFAYRTPLSWWVFASGGAIMLVIAFIILSVRTFRAAIANPVKNLRAE
ncbi:MAG TPA: FtsX-like permease family protein [Chitinophagaceae bacterium]|nr:FtsX-like permease family protein [Chitinophagaceae bacterium]